MLYGQFEVEEDSIMSASPDLNTSILNVLGALMSVDNAARKAAETYFSTQLAADPYVPCALPSAG